MPSGDRFSSIWHAGSGSIREIYKLTISLRTTRTKSEMCNTRKYSASLRGIPILLSRIDVEKTTYLLAVPVNVEESLQILIERRTKFRLKLHLEAAISCMTSYLCSFRSSAVATVLCVVTKRVSFPKTFAAISRSWAFSTGLGGC